MAKWLIHPFVCRIYNCVEIDGPDCVVDLVPEEEAWHYLQISPTGSPVQLSVAVKLYCELLLWPNLQSMMV